MVPNIELLKLIRNILLRAFVIGLGFAIFYGGATFLFWKPIIQLTSDQLHIISHESFGLVVVSFLTEVRFFLIFCLLTPALALHWTIRKLAKA
jgi:Na+-driven multidrug efflux pump